MFNKALHWSYSMLLPKNLALFFVPWHRKKVLTRRSNTSIPLRGCADRA